MNETKKVEALVSLGDRYLGKLPAFEADERIYHEGDPAHALRAAIEVALNLSA